MKRAETEGTLDVSYELRKDVLDRSGGTVRTADAFTYQKPQKLTGAAETAWLRDEANWLPERRALHDRIVGVAVEKARTLSERLGTSGVVYALRGNTASGKSTAVRAHPELGALPTDAKGDLAGVINPDPIKAELAELEGGTVSNTQVHLEGSLLSKRVEAEVLRDPEMNLVFDKRFAGREDIPNLLKSIGNRKLKLIDMDVPLETSAARVLKRKQGEEPTVPFAQIAEGFEGIRKHRKMLIDGDGQGFAGVKADPQITDYDLYVMNTKGQSVLVASKHEGVWHGPDTPEKVALFDMAANPSPDVIADIAHMKSTVIDDAFIDKMVAAIQAPKEKMLIQQALTKYKGKTLGKALDEHDMPPSASEPSGATPTNREQ